MTSASRGIARPDPVANDRWKSSNAALKPSRRSCGKAANIGHPTLRLIRWSVGDWTLDGFASGDWRTA
ncbi:hypothetical protein [Sedimentitalea arenosa]|uniref:hypothetical protein n=1 Tax=Sedimentitalea arenosa TaxID=2798803 RepID=UPI002E27DCA9|nr:hypothetical protein [Arenibacterium arenosum]